MCSFPKGTFPSPQFLFSTQDCVVRFRKLSPEERIRREEFLLQVTGDLTFINDVARPLAGPLLVDEARLVSVDPCLLERVMERIRPLRDGKNAPPPPPDLRAHVCTSLCQVAYESLFVYIHFTLHTIVINMRFHETQIYNITVYCT